LQPIANAAVIISSTRIVRTRLRFIAQHYAQSLGPVF